MRAVVGSDRAESTLITEDFDMMEKFSRIYRDRKGSVTGRGRGRAGVGVREWAGRDANSSQVVESQ